MKFLQLCSRVQIKIKRVNMKKKLFILLFIIVGILCCLKTRPLEEGEEHFSKKIDDSKSIKTTLVLGVEQRGGLCRGWNDLTMLIIQEKDRVKVISFPRDTLVFISPKGYWTINAMYLVLNIEGMINHFQYQYGVKVDRYIVYNLNEIDELSQKVESIPGIPKRFKNMLGHYEYINDWVRHRHKLRFEIDRQRRIHAFLAYLFEKMNKEKVKEPILSLASSFLLNHSEKTSFSKKSIKKFYHNLLGKRVDYYIWDGQHQNANFNLRAYDKKIFVGEKMVYVLDHNDMTKLKPYKNPYKFSTKNFFETTGSKIPIRVKKGFFQKGKELTWNGGFTQNYKKLISDEQFTDQNWNDSDIFKFIHSFPNNKMTDSQIKHLIKECRRTKINIWVAMAQIQKESSLIVNNTSFDYTWRVNAAMGYAAAVIKTLEDGTRITANYGFEIQITKGLDCMRKWFDHYEPEATITLLSYEGAIKPANAASYSLYKYTPFYSECYPHKPTYMSVGNRRFMAVWYMLQREKRKIFKKNS